MGALRRKLAFICIAFVFIVFIYLLASGPDSSRDIVKMQQNSGGFVKSMVQAPVKDSNKGVTSDVNLRKPLPTEKKRPKVASTTVISPIHSATKKSSVLPFKQDPYAGPQNAQQKEVVAAFMHAWTAYKNYAMGHDEFKPLSRGWQEWMGGIGLTLVDSLDTMYIMGLKKEFDIATEWVKHNLTFDKDSDVQLFEITIRELGGLMSAYYLSNNQVFLQKAVSDSKVSALLYLSCGEHELADRLLPCFGGRTKVPCNRINLANKQPSFVEISTAESGTIQLEFRALSRALKLDRFENVAFTVSEHLHRLKKMDGLVSCFLSPHSGQFRLSSTVSAGASADSYYEYLLKQWHQTGQNRQWLIDDYMEAVEGIKKHLLRYSKPSGFAFVGALSSAVSQNFRAEMEHLACFLPGTLALGYMLGAAKKDHLELAEKLTLTCYEMYRQQPTGLSPEVASINMNDGAKQDIYVSFHSQYNLQRPETVESIYYMYKATKDKKYRDWGWQIFKSFEKYTKLKDGYASIDSVKRPENPGYRDKMETFYLAETLKYLYLLFSDDDNLLPLEKWVFNTEAHPLPVYDS